MEVCKDVKAWEKIIQESPDIICTIGPSGKIINLNGACKPVLGYECEEVEGRQFEDFIHPEDLPNTICIVQEIINGFKTNSFENRFIHKSGKEVNIVWSGVWSEEDEVVLCIGRDVTEQKLARQKLNEKDELNKVFIKHGSDIVSAFDKDLNYLYSGPSTFRELGYLPEQLIGTSAVNYVHPADIPLIKESVLEVLASGEGIVKVPEFRFKDAKGEWRWFETIAINQLHNPAIKAIVTCSRDITERVKAMQELEKLSLVASKTINGVVITDANGVTEWLNEGFTNLTGYAFSEVVGKSLAPLLQGEETDKATAKRIIEKRKEGKPFQEEILNYKKSGEKVWFLLDFTPVRDELGKVIKFIFIQTDITFRKEAEANQLQFTKDLYNQNKDLQQFTYIVSHNLRSPVATAMGLVDFLASTDRSSADFNSGLNYLKGSINKMDIVLKDLNTVLSVRDKRDTIEKEKVKLAPIFQQVIEEQQEPLKNCGGEVSLDIEEGFSVSGNKAYLYSIFYNLLSNAIKFRSPDRALKVKIKCLSKKDRGTIITFSDNGLGFDMNLAGDKVFQLYKRFHSNSEGRGMGLFLVKTHLETMGGHIEVTSQVNLGTRFLIYLK